MRGVGPGRGIYSAVPQDTLIVIADAHLGAPEGADPRVLHRFLETVPALGDHLLIAGDLFEFLFVHARTLPRSAFPTLAALTRLRARSVALSVLGGNHDRWARDLWERELDATFDPDVLRLTVGGRTVEARHGDGLSEPDMPSRALGWLLRRRPVVGAVRWLHPDLLHALVDRMSHGLAGREEDLAAAEVAQRAWARQRLDAEDAPDVLVMAHTHRAAVMEASRRWYVNPGAWLDGGRYAVVTAGGTPQLGSWAG